MSRFDIVGKKMEIWSVSHFLAYSAHTRLSVLRSDVTFRC